MTGLIHLVTGFCEPEMRELASSALSPTYTSGR